MLNRILYQDESHEITIDEFIAAYEAASPETRREVDRLLNMEREETEG